MFSLILIHLYKKITERFVIVYVLGSKFHFLPIEKCIANNLVHMTMIFPLRYRTNGATVAVEVAKNRESGMKGEINREKDERFKYTI